MSINFVVPDKLSDMFTRAAIHLNLQLDVNQLVEDIRLIANMPHHTRVIEKMYLGIIPDDLPVCVMDGDDVKLINSKHNLPNSMELAATIVHNADEVHKVVLLVDYRFAHYDSIIKHELVHYKQINDGYLRSNEVETVWCKDDVLFALDNTKDMIELIKLSGDEDALMLYELHKPWELEAYALTMTVDELKPMCDMFKEKIYRYRKLHGIAVV